MKEKETYVALLRGINVGGHHKVPMAELRELIEDMGFTKVKTLLNSGNIVFESESIATSVLEDKFTANLERAFGFPIPVIVRKAKTIKAILSADPFTDVEVNKKIRLYVTFIKHPVKEKTDLELPWISDDGSFNILSSTDTEVFGVLDLSQGKTTKAMLVLGKTYGDNITTRNWNTIVKIGKLL